MEKGSKQESISTPNLFTAQRMVGLASEFGFVIAVPLVLFGLAGKWLDARQHTNKLFTLIGILAALVVSTAFLIRRLRSIMLSIKSASALKVPKE